ncbi:hypothetical protein [Acidithiobacillus sp.]|uniref:hypothetical protein n=1 Tax=Acidithiobacillus sp. TaxID=1872118 RepID=UPI003D03494D
MKVSTFYRLAGGLAVAGTLALSGCATHQHHLGPYGGHSISWYAHHVKRAELENHWCNNLSPDRQELKWVQKTCVRANVGWLKDAGKYHWDLANGDTMGSIPRKDQGGGW